MAGRHAAPAGSKKPVIIIVVAVILTAAAVGAALFFMNGGFSMFGGDDKPTQPATTAPATTAAATTQAATEAVVTQTSDGGEGSDDIQQTTAEAPAPTETAPQPTTIDIAIPTEDSGEVTYFNATYIPNGQVIDLSTGENVTLRDVFGATYPEGVLTFNDDGTFTDTINASGIDSGAYLVQNGQIKATYVYDRNMNITVTEWNGNTPAEFYIIYGGSESGYQVFFSEN